MAEQEHPTDEFVNVFTSSNLGAETEAELVHGLLESAGLDSVIVRQNVPELPTGVVEVRVLASQAADARALIESSTSDEEE